MSGPRTAACTLGHIFLQKLICTFVRVECNESDSITWVLFSSRNLFAYSYERSAIHCVPLSRSTDQPLPLGCSSRPPQPPHRINAGTGLANGGPGWGVAEPGAALPVVHPFRAVSDRHQKNSRTPILLAWLSLWPVKVPAVKLTVANGNGG